jgi:hypothetical protein
VIHPGLRTRADRATTESPRPERKAGCPAVSAQRLRKDLVDIRRCTHAGACAGGLFLIHPSPRRSRPRVIQRPAPAARSRDGCTAGQRRRVATANRGLRPKHADCTARHPRKHDSRNVRAGDAATGTSEAGSEPPGRHVRGLGIGFWRRPRLLHPGGYRVPSTATSTGQARTAVRRQPEERTTSVATRRPCSPRTSENPTQSGPGRRAARRPARRPETAKISSPAGRILAAADHQVPDRREVEMDRWGWESLDPRLETPTARQDLRRASASSRRFGSQAP